MAHFNVVIYCLYLVLICKESLSAPEPLCSKFSYDEQLLEKMVRMEFNVQNMEKNMKASEEKIQETRTNILETKSKMENMLKLIDDKIKELQEREVELMGNISNAISGSQRDPTVAFHASEAADKSLATNQVIVFTKVNMNEGSGYDKTNGFFTATVAGIYHFNSHLCVKSGKDLEYVIVVNDKTWASGLFTANSEGRCTSFSVTVQMHSGERAWVTIDKGGSSTTDKLYEDPDDWNYFTGFLVHRLD